MSRFFLNSYRPLQKTLGGREAAERHGIAPYVDASCRREPDFEASLPAVTALCRRRKFAPRLHPGDRVAYMTVKFGGYWRLVALMVVERRFESHTEAAGWYARQHLPLPNNLMVQGNPPRPLDETYRCGPCSSAAELRQWDQHYRARAEECGVVLACRPLFLELWQPPAITESDWIAWYGRIPQTRAGLEIDELLWRHLDRRARAGR